MFKKYIVKNQKLFYHLLKHTALFCISCKKHEILEYFNVLIYIFFLRCYFSHVLVKRLLVWYGTGATYETYLAKKI